MPPSDEKDYRRPDWREGVNVVLADGQAWALPRVLVRLVPTADGKDYEPYARVGDAGDRTFSDLLKAHDEAVEENDDKKYFLTELQLARHLLLVNYDLDGGQVAELLQFSLDVEADPEGARIRQEVLDVVFCRRASLPKPTGGG